MGEPLRSPESSQGLSPHQLTAGTIYLGQVFSGLVGLTQVAPKELWTAALLSNSDISPDPSLSDRLLSALTSQFLAPGKSLTQAELTTGIQALSHLCQQHQELIRRAVSLLEQMIRESQDPWQVTLLKNYSHTLATYYPRDGGTKEVTSLGEKLLFDLLFYSSPSGTVRLWSRCTQSTK